MAPHTQRDICFCQRLAWDLNVLVVDVAYRTSTEAPFPTACYQAYDCVKWVLESAAELDIDPGKLITVGHSAGGNLALGVSLLAQEKKEFSIALQVLDYPPVDLCTDPADKPDAFHTAVLPERAREINLLYLDDPSNGQKVLASPTLANPEQLAGMPEAVMITGVRDNLRHEAEQYAAKLIAAGVPVHCRRFTGSRHGFVITCFDEYEEAILFMETMIRQIRTN